MSPKNSLLRHPNHPACLSGASLVRCQQAEELPLPPEPHPLPVLAAAIPVRSKPSAYPEPFASPMAGRAKRQSGEQFGLSNFGVNLTHLAPGAVPSLRHAHTKQNEFISILKGHPTLHSDQGKTKLSPGMCAGFKAGSGNAHRLIYGTDAETVYLEVGDRRVFDSAAYPDDDLKRRPSQGPAD